MGCGSPVHHDGYLVTKKSSKGNLSLIENNEKKVVKSIIDTSRNFNSVIPAKHDFYLSKKILDSIPLCKSNCKSLKVELHDIEFDDGTGKITNIHELRFIKNKVEIKYINSMLNSLMFNGVELEIFDVPFEKTPISYFTMDTYFSNSYLFQIDDDNLFLLQICPPDWTGRMMQFRLYYLLDPSTGKVTRFIA